MTEAPGNLYDYPRYYDLVFGSDWKAEYDFLGAVFAQHVQGKVKRLFEPACGTGRLLFRLGQAGYRVAGLDLNPRAVDYCNKRLVKYGLPASVFVGDMADFTLPQPACAAFNMINSFRHLLTEKQAGNHLQCMGEAVRPGGLYALGLHLTPTEGEPLTEETWGARRGHLQINTHLQTFEVDRRKRLERCRMSMHVYTPSQATRIVDELVFRTYTWPQMKHLLAQHPQWRLIGAYDFRYQPDNPIEIDSGTQDVVLMLQRR